MDNKQQLQRRINLTIYDIDPELLKKQKLGLINTIFKLIHKSQNDNIVDIELKDDIEALEGINNLLDHITDKVDNNEYVLTEIYKKR